MQRRLPSQPPVLPGYSYIRVLGSGGFADVFLYEQNAPRRQVAVKVMLAGIATPGMQQMFQAEANLMAQLSSHPSILTVYQTAVTADGRPYLVMELCSSALGSRYRTEPVAVADALQIGVQIASAVETAHRAGVLHRDIKPSNILMTAYGHPVLSDFGIAATLGGLESAETVGMSIPWSAPELLLDDTTGTVDSEIWSLAATIFSLLAGRSPFEVPGKENTSAELISRITRGRPQPIGRADVPASLEAVLDKAMSRKPAGRQASVLELIRDLQSVESELGLAQTRAEIKADDWAISTASDDDDRTRVHKIVSVDAGRSRRRRVSNARTARSTGALSAGSVEERSAGTGTVAPHGSRALVWTISACAVLFVVIGVVVVIMMFRASTRDTIPVVQNVTGRVSNGTVIFSWHDPGLAQDDAYQVRVGDGPVSIQHSTQFRVDSANGKQVCITVTVNRNGTTGQPSARTCVGGGS